MILLSSPLKNDPLETTVTIFFFLEIEIVTTNMVNSKSLKKICRQLLSTMNVLNECTIYVEFSNNGAVAHTVLTELDDQKLLSRGMASYVS